MLKKSHSLTVLAVWAPLVLASGCSLERSQEASLIIDLGGTAGSQIDLSSGLLDLNPMDQFSVATPADLSGFECLSVNVPGLLILRGQFCCRA